MNNDQHQANILARKYDAEVNQESNSVDQFCAEIILGVLGGGVLVGIVWLMWILKEAVQ